MAVGMKLSKAQCPTAGSLEQKEMLSVPVRPMIGSLRHVERMTRPDISFALKEVSKFMANPGRIYARAVTRIMKYLQGSKGLHLTFGQLNHHERHGQLELFADSSWADVVDSSLSTTGFIVFFEGSPISWCSKDQKTVALSTQTAELVAAVEGAKVALWLRDLLTEMGIVETKCVRLYQDNNAAITWMNGMAMGRARHVMMRVHWLRELVRNKTIVVERCDSAMMRADGLTKALDNTKMQDANVLLGLLHPESVVAAGGHQNYCNSLRSEPLMNGGLYLNISETPGSSR